MVDIEDSGVSMSDIPTGDNKEILLMNLDWTIGKIRNNVLYSKMRLRQLDQEKIKTLKEIESMEAEIQKQEEKKKEIEQNQNLR